MVHHCFVLGNLVQFSLIFYRMEFDKTRLSCPWNSDQNCTQNAARRWWGGRGSTGGRGWWSVGGMSDIRTEVKSLKIDIAERTLKL